MRYYQSLSLPTTKTLPMKRYAEAIHLRPKHEAEYIRHHAQVWPEVLKTIESCNIRNYSIFLRKGTLFAYFEYYGVNYAARTWPRWPPAPTPSAGVAGAQSAG